MLLIAMMALLGFNQDVFFRGTETYAPHMLRAVVTPQGEVYVLTKEKQIFRYNNQGEKVGVFAGKGQGPGELEAPLKIGYHQERIWVFDFQRQGVSFYNLEGKFLNRHAIGGIGSDLHKMEEGWVFARMTYGKEVPANLIFLDEKMSQEKQIYQWVPLWMSPGKPYRGLSKKMGVNPAREFFHIQPDKSGRFLFLAQTGPSFKIDIFELQSQKVVRTIKRDIQPIPFNKNWGEAQVAESNQHSKTGRQLTLRAPEYFPIIRRMRVSPENLLVVELWTGLPDKRKTFRIFDLQGNDATLGYDPAHVFRLLEITNNQAYLTGFDDQAGEAIIIKCPLKNIDEVAKNNPINYESKRGIFIMLE